MAKIEVKSDIICQSWKELTGADIERCIFEETMYKVSLPLVLLRDIRKDFCLDVASGKSEFAK